MSPKIASELQAVLQAAHDRPINVEIEFSEQPPDAEVQALGLRREGNVAWGTLTRPQVEAAAQVPQVVAIRLSHRPAPSPPAGPAQIGPRLQLEMMDESRHEFFVSVVFRAPAEPIAGLPSLSIHLDVGTGMLTREQIHELARRDDVISIDSIPETQLA